MIPPDIFPSPDALGDAVALEIFAGVLDAETRGRNYVLGCPAGRTPLPVYEALARQARGLDLSRLHLILMDEFVLRDGQAWRRAPTTAHYSCAGFAIRHIASSLPGLPSRNLHVPDPASPAAYDGLIEDLGGIDLFLLASGATDGHVAFNPPGTPLDSGTRIVALAEETRRDNLATFPDFQALDEVPTHGVSIGLGAIARHSRAAVMMLHGAHKGAALRRLRALDRFDPAWPASVIYACRNPRILVDAAAAAEG